MQEEEIIARIQDLCAVRGWTFYRLAKQSGITYSTLCTMLHKSTAPSIPTLVRLCRGFDITLPEFFDTNNDWAKLTCDQKKHLEKWDSLTHENQESAEKFMQYLLCAQQKSGQDQQSH